MPLAYPTKNSYTDKMYSITWDGETTSASSDRPYSSWTWDTGDYPYGLGIEILEDGPWSPLYEYEDYVGLMHAVLAMELGLDEEDF